MTDTIATLEKSLSVLKLKVSASEISDFMLRKEFSDSQIASVADVFAELSRRKEESSVDFLLKCSRLPVRNLRTFENFGSITFFVGF